MMKLLTLLLATLYCASAFGLHSATSQVKSLGLGSSHGKAMVQPIDFQARPSTVVSIAIIAVLTTTKNSGSLLIE